MDTVIEVNRLRVYAYIGVMEQEGTVGNDFEVTVHLRYPVETDTDSILHTANYAEIIETIKEVMRRRSALIEHAAFDLQHGIASKWPLSTGGMVKVAKLMPPVSNAQLESAAVTVNW